MIREIIIVAIVIIGMYLNLNGKIKDLETKLNNEIERNTNNLEYIHNTAKKVNKLESKKEAKTKQK